MANNEKLIAGSCICHRVKFLVKDDFLSFKLCHCHFCQKASGSSNVANAFTFPHNIKWLRGVKQLQQYDVPDSQVRRVFCKHCGTTMPFVSQNGHFLVVPTGILSEQPKLPPQQIIYWHERMPWFDDAKNLEPIED